MKHTIYIITDSNRAYLEVRYCTDINNRLNEIRDSSPILFGSSPKLRNIVHLENYNSSEEAQMRKQQLQEFTRMQRERIIRMKNPDWLNLAPLVTPPVNKKVVVYA